jgi:hypothetical protein
MRPILSTVVAGLLVFLVIHFAATGQQSPSSGGDPNDDPSRTNSQAKPGVAPLTPSNNSHRDRDQKKTRPRTIAEARNPRTPKTLTLSERIRVDAVIQNYDSRLCKKVRDHWHELVMPLSPSSAKGSVTIKFHLLPDGRVIALQTVRTTSDDAVTLLCQKSILDCVPFERWPPEMLDSMVTDYREIQFNFDYETSEMTNIQSSGTEQKGSQPQMIAETRLSPVADHLGVDHVSHSLTPAADRRQLAEIRKYDVALRERVSDHWHTALEIFSTTPQKGAATLKFHLLPDGRVTTLEVVRTTGDNAFTLLCQKAIHDSVPFEKWPPLMHVLYKDYREITFEFNYTTDK